MGRIIIHPRKKQKVFEKDNFKCVICGASGDFNCLEADHIIPVVDGGTNEYSNLQTLCYKCNMKKRFGKGGKNLDYTEISPLDKLELIKNRIHCYKNLTYPEFKVIFTQDELFRCLRLDLLYVNDLFFEISGFKKENNRDEARDKASRDKLIRYIYQKKDILGITQEEIAKIAKIGRKTVWNILDKEKTENFPGI